MLERLLPREMRIGEGEEPVEEYVAWGEALVHVDRYPNPDAPAKLVILHGGGGNGRLMAPLALMAYRAGYEVVAPDLPGYGLTVVPGKSRLVYEDWVTFATDFLKAEHGRDGKPIVVFGLSMGGLLAYEAAARSEVPAGLIATNLLDQWYLEVRRATASKPWMGSLIGPAFAVLGPVWDPLKVPARYIASMGDIVNDLEMAGVLVRDPLGGGNWMPGRFFRTYVEHVPSVEPEDFGVCPVLLAHPGEDRWTPVETSRPFFDRLSVEKQLIMLENAGHLPVEQPGVDQLREALLNFIAASVERSPVGA